MTEAHQCSQPVVGRLEASVRRLPRKVERRCPRCHRHAYHWLNAARTESNSSSRTKAGCVNCGHEWLCRVMEKDL